MKRRNRHTSSTAGSATSTREVGAAAAAVKLAVDTIHRLQDLPAGQLHRLQQALAVIALLAAVCVVHLHLTLSQTGCQRLKDSFNSSAVLASLQEQSAAAAAASSSSTQKLHIVTVIGSNTPAIRIENAPLLQGLPPSMRHMVVVLRAGSRIGHGLEGFGAFGAKMIELYKFVTSPGVAPHDLVLLTDGFDVVMDTKAINDIPARFAAITSAASASGSSSSGSRDGGISLALVFAAERTCWPDKRRRSCFPAPGSSYRYLNAGGLIGHAGYILALLQPFMKQITWWTDDQGWYTTAYLALRERNGFHLDTSCEIFQTLNKVEVGSRDLVFDESRGSWYNAETKSYPVLLHANGPVAIKNTFLRKVVPMLSAAT